MLTPLLALAVLALTPAQQRESPGQPGARAHHWLVYDEGRKSVLLCGGSTPVGDGFRFYDDVWSFDGAAWTRVGELKRPESGMRLVSVPDGGGLIAFGGYTRSGRTLGELREWVGGEWTTLDPAGDKAASESGFVLDRQRARYVLFGGSFDGGNRGTTWEWNGAAWQAFDGPGPRARSTHGMVYDQRRGKVVLFGGASNGPLGDTWEWDGSSWREIPGRGPSARLAPGMTYDTQRGLTILFGGGAPAGSLGDTWTFDGAKWEERKIPGPPARISPAMAYDPKRDVVVLFGGRRAWPNDLADTWLFDGTRWREAGAR